MVYKQKLVFTTKYCENSKNSLFFKDLFDYIISLLLFIGFISL